MDERSSGYPGWRVVAACFVMALFSYGFGFYGQGVYLAELTIAGGTDAPKFSTGMVSAATTAYYLLSALLVLFLGEVIVKLGPRIVAAIGAVALALSLLLISRIESLFDLFISYLTMSIAWATLTNAAITNILGLWFASKRGLAISLALNGASAGGITIAPLLAWSSGRIAFSTTLQLAALATLAILLTTVVVWVDRPASQAVAAITDAGVTTADRPITRREVLRTAHFWTIAAPFALAIMAQVGFVVHQVAFLFPSLGRDGAGIAVAATTTMAVLGRLGVGIYIDHLDPRRVTALLLAVQATALLAMIQSKAPWVLYPACAIFGVSVGNIITLPVLVVQREYPAVAFGMLSALVVSIIQLTFAFGPALIGWLRDTTGGYNAPLMVCVALELTAATTVLRRRVSPS
jgi:MFS family permease